jgi:hypothetical protein
MRRQRRVLYPGPLPGLRSLADQKTAVRLPAIGDDIVNSDAVAILRLADTAVAKIYRSVY